MTNKEPTMTKHRHRAVRTETRPFAGPVTTPANPAAHGNVCYVDHCRCGATKRRNVNQTHKECGPWVKNA